MPHLISLIGPTAIGKTALSLQLAKHFDCEILSCDSRQFFREMTIGTAVPEPEELGLVRHHFIHHKSIFEPYSVGDFEKDALGKLDQLFQKRPVAVMVGGSGLYVDAVLKGFDTFPDVDAATRDFVRKHYQTNGIAWLQTELERLDKIYYNRVDTANPQRMMRALEVALASGRPYSDFLKGNENQRRFTPIIVGLDAPRDVIYDRINRRVDIMVKEGLVEEARTVYPHRELNALQTVGYRELFRYFDGEISLEAAIEDIKMNTRRFAKRQLTWFRRTEGTTWFDHRTDIGTIVAHIQAQMTQL